MSSSKGIGFFDSGIGGVTVLKEAVKLMPNENFVYFSDSAYNPYGEKSDEEIINRSYEIAKELIFEQNCKVIVIACNTASAKAAQYLRDNLDIPIIAIEPSYKMVYDNNPDGFTLVMATSGTLESEKFNRLYYKYNNHNTKLIACTGLANLIECKESAQIFDYLQKTVGKYKGKAKNVVLGCTHYPLVKDEIKAVLGDVKFFDGANGVSRRLLNVLEENDLLNDSNGTGKIKFIDSSKDSRTRQLKEERFYRIISEGNI